MDARVREHPVQVCSSAPGVRAAASRLPPSLAAPRPLAAMKARFHARRAA